MKDGYFKHDVVLEFLKKLGEVFQWKIYESSTLRKDTLLSWYALILCEWMEGNGLNYIMPAALKHHREKPENFWINNLHEALITTMTSYTEISCLRIHLRLSKI